MYICTYLVYLKIKVLCTVAEQTFASNLMRHHESLYYAVGHKDYMIEAQTPSISDCAT